MKIFPVVLRNSKENKVCIVYKDRFEFYTLSTKETTSGMEESISIIDQCRGNGYKEVHSKESVFTND